MDVREKLVELLFKCAPQNTKAEWRGTKIEVCISQGKIADYLVAHGVTVQEQNGCEHCLTASYTENPFTVINKMGREVKTQFNFCPKCGRRLPQPPKGE